MRALVAVFAFVAVASAGPRSRRQAEEFFCSNGDVCVPYYLCRDGNVVTDGGGLIDIRIKPRNGVTPANDTRSADFITECPNFLDVCCYDPNSTPPPPPPYTAQCGRRNEDGVNARISGFTDKEAQFGEFPWQVAVLQKVVEGENEANHYVCGAALIHPQVVLTAAHCVAKQNPDSLFVRLGEWDTQKAYELYPHQDHKVASVITHEAFNQKNLHNDVALLFLETPAVLAPNVDTICLPEQDQIFDGYYCWATGWGKDKFGKEGVFQNILKEIELPIVNYGDCQSSLRKTRLGHRFVLDKSFTCAGGIGSADTCTGDGGSPLVCQVGDSYVQAGIVAWGIGCGEDGIPGVYVDVPAFSYWIRDTANSVLNSQYGYTGNIL